MEAYDQQDRSDFMYQDACMHVHRALEHLQQNSNKTHKDMRRSRSHMGEAIAFDRLFDLCESVIQAYGDLSDTAELPSQRHDW